MTASTGAAPKGCKRCGNIAKSGLKCIKCGVLTHKKCCERLKLRVYNLINCCDEITDEVGDDAESTQIASSDVVEEPADATTSEIEIFYLKQMLRQKDVIIENQNVAITALQDQVQLLKSSVYMPSATSNGPKPMQRLKKAADSSSYAKVTVNKSETYRKTDNTSGGNSLEIATDNRGRTVRFESENGDSDVNINKQTITSEKVRNAIHSAQKHQKLNSIINLGGDSGFPKTSNTPGVNEHRRNNYGNRNQPIVGKKVINESSGLKAAVRKAFLHVYKLHPDTELDTLTAYLQPTFPEVKIEKITSLRPEHYSSFKVEVDFDNMEKIKDPELWPAGTCVNRFFHRKKTAETTT